MPQSKEVHKEYMRKYRGSQKGSQIIGRNIRSNRIIEVDTKTAAKLLLICQSLNRETKELSGRRTNLLHHVRFGVSGPTFAEIYPKLKGEDAIK